MNSTSVNQTAYTLSIDGMTCGHCIKTVTTTLASTPGVAVQSVTLGSALISATDKTDVSGAIAALEESGYTAHVQETTAALRAQDQSGSSCCSSEKSSPSRGGCCG